MIDEHKSVLPASPPEALKRVGGNGPLPVRAGDETYQSMSEAGGRAWQLHATARAADHFVRQDAPADRSTGSWLVACAVDLAEEVAAELDSIARSLKERPTDAALSATLHPLRTRAHKLHAAARAADHFLDQDTGEDRSTASWLVACALELATRLANGLDDQAGQLRRSSAGVDTRPPAFSDVLASRKTSPRGAMG